MENMHKARGGTAPSSWNEHFSSDTVTQWVCGGQVVGRGHLWCWPTGSSTTIPSTWQDCTFLYISCFFGQQNVNRSDMCDLLLGRSFKSLTNHTLPFPPLLSMLIVTQGHLGGNFKTGVLEWGWCLVVHGHSPQPYHRDRKCEWKINVCCFKPLRFGKMFVTSA